MHSKESDMNLFKKRLAKGITYQSIIKYLLILASAIFVTEIFVMAIIRFLLPSPIPHILVYLLVDPVMLISLLAPQLYFFLFKPMTLGITRSERLERKQIARRRNVQYATTRVLADSETLDDATHKILQALCESLEWDLGELWTVDKKNNLLHLVEIWHKPSAKFTEFVALSRQTAFATGIGLPGRILASGKPSWITDVVADTNFPRASIAAKEGLHGAFGFPILSGNEILGVVDFFNHEIEPPDEDLLKMMNVIGIQIGQFIERKKAVDALNHKVDFEKTVANISTRFVMLQDFDNAISTSLADIGTLSVADRVYLFQFRDNGAIVDNTHEWCAKGVAPEIQHLQNLPSSLFSWWMKNLYDNKIIQITDVSQMPHEAGAEKDILEKQGIKSLIALPVYSEMKLAGFIGFDNVTSPGMWSDECIDLLRITAGIIGNAIARKQSESIIRHMAYHDSLTNLPNRILFQDRLQVAIVHARRNETKVAVIVLDLDNFKNINDNLGHHAGDMVLKTVAERLTQSVRKGDTVARMGGDEFMIILPDLNLEEDAAVVAQKIIYSLYQPFCVDDNEIRIMVSVGVSLFPANADNSENLIKQADTAMYLSKKRGGNVCNFFGTF